MILLACYVLLLCLAAGYDVVALRIPNPISIGLIVLFLLRGLAEPSHVPWLDHLTSGFLVFLVGSVLFRSGWMGGGDVKLLAATSLWTGSTELPAHVLITALGGGLLGLVLLVVRPLIRPLLARIPPAQSWWVPSSLAPEAGVPYGVPIAISAILVSAREMPQAATLG